MARFGVTSQNRSNEGFGSFASGSCPSLARLSNAGRHVQRIRSRIHTRVVPRNDRSGSERAFRVTTRERRQSAFKRRSPPLLSGMSPPRAQSPRVNARCSYRLPRRCFELRVSRAPRPDPFTEPQRSDGDSVLLSCSLPPGMPLANLPRLRSLRGPVQKRGPVGAVHCARRQALTGTKRWSRGPRTSSSPIRAGC